MKSFDAYLDDYLKRNKTEVMSSVALQGLSTYTDYLNTRGLAKKLHYEPTKAVSPKQVHFLRTNVYDDLKRDIDRQFNSAVQANRSLGREVDSRLLGAYSASLMKARMQQASLDSQTINREVELNAQMEQRTDALNSQIDARNKQMQYQVDVQRSGIEGLAQSQLSTGLANIANIVRRSGKEEFDTVMSGLYYKARLDALREQSKSVAANESNDNGFSMKLFEYFNNYFNNGTGTYPDNQ